MNKKKGEKTKNQKQLISAFYINNQLIYLYFIKLKKQD